MSSVIDSFPVVYGRYIPTGELSHVDAVENGRACNCVCPDPQCGQRLIAKNGGDKRIHHFAHERGTCNWAVEYVISKLAAKAIEARGSLAFPALSYFDVQKRQEVVHAQARIVRIDRVELGDVSGRRAPDVFVTTCAKNGAERKFAFVFQLANKVTVEQVAALAKTTEGVVLVDLWKDMRRAIREQGRHVDRDALVKSYQDEGLIAEILNDTTCDIASWKYNARKVRLLSDSVARKEEDERKRREESERWQKEYEERLKAKLEAQQREAEEQRRVWEAEQAELRKKQEILEAEAELRAIEEEKREEAMLQARHSEQLAKMRILVEQQDVQAIDEYGTRWVKCEECGKVAPEREFSFYGGMGRMNLGICSECMRRER